MQRLEKVDEREKVRKDNVFMPRKMGLYLQVVAMEALRNSLWRALIYTVLGVEARRRGRDVA